MLQQTCVRASALTLSPAVYLPCARFKLNIAMGQFAEAARDALEMARFEQVRQCERKACAKLPAPTLAPCPMGREHGILPPLCHPLAVHFV